MTTAVDPQFAPPYVWGASQERINAYLAGTGSQADAIAALDEYSQDIWGMDAPAKSITFSEFEGDVEAYTKWRDLFVSVHGIPS